MFNSTRFKPLQATVAFLLRSYPSKWEPNTGCTIWQAARATSAAPLYFNGIKFGVPPITYVDGGLHNNNPVRILYEEAMGLINASSGQTIGCIVNTGNGLPPLRDLGMPFLFPFALLILSRIIKLHHRSVGAQPPLLVISSWNEIRLFWQKYLPFQIPRLSHREPGAFVNNRAGMSLKSIEIVQGSLEPSVLASAFVQFSPSSDE
ncbi:hypothetical protein CIRG_10140 [Coccidioides immitis RMSCC 2394]|uniref:PNPLA domain-containing protein n=1 Tax=Coccidioides immitis RMSCC 2394 TaxID=404692 RepID=A0A0J7AY20_COCIT|nr:hypothetical protein CIRG_10140 [Coccidioides immitis RMSCC 2394]